MTDYYNATGIPVPGAFGDATPVAAEFSSIQSGISAKLAPLAGHGLEIVRINSGGTAQESITLTTLAGLIPVRVSSEVSSATPTINTDAVSVHRITALATDITSMTSGLSGTPTHDQPLIIEITGTASRGITWGSAYEASLVSLPTTTSNTDMLTCGFLYNSATSKWRIRGKC